MKKRLVLVWAEIQAKKPIKAKFAQYRSKAKENKIDDGAEILIGKLIIPT